MFYNWKAIIFGFCFVIVFVGFSCVRKVYSDDRMQIDPSFLNIFNSVTKKGSFSFRDSNNNRKAFIITNIDSVISNQKGWFINEAPYKLLIMKFREVGPDTTQLERMNEIFVNKDPAANRNSLCIQFNNFYYSGDSLPSLNYDPLYVNGKIITGYYFFKTSLDLKHSNDVKELYISAGKGFLGFKTSSGEFWSNEE